MELLYRWSKWFSNENNDANNYGVNSNKTTTNISFQYKTKLRRRTPNNNSRLNAEVVVHWNIWVFFGDLSICLWLTVKKKKDLAWSKDCLISEILGALDVDGANPANETFQVKRFK